MKITIDTVNKTIEIEEATTEELKKLCKDYKGFKIKSKVINNWSYPYYTWPLISPTISEPYYYDGTGYSIPCTEVITTELTTSDTTYYKPGNITYTN